MATLTNQPRHTASLGNAPQHAAPLSNQAKTLRNELILLENGFYALMENGDFFMLEQSVPSGPAVTNQPKH